MYRILKITNNAEYWYLEALILTSLKNQKCEKNVCEKTNAQSTQISEHFCTDDFLNLLKCFHIAFYNVLWNEQSGSPSLFLKENSLKTKYPRYWNFVVAIATAVTKRILKILYTL